jgi:hypothetical protein
LGTNSTNIARAALLETTSTNALVITTETNSTALTNLTSASGKTLTNTITAGVSAKGGTNTSARASTGTNSTNILVLVALPDQPGTNKTVAENSGKTNATSKPDGTNTVAAKGGPGSPTNSAGPRSMARMGGFPGGPPGMGAKPPDLPPLPKARVDRIVQSEILAQVMRPMPMALLGIAGQHAFLRSANGQTGIVKEGDEIGGLKLLRIGTNRVLVESEGQKKELMIFAGFGGDSLDPKPEKTTNEPSKK